MTQQTQKPSLGQSLGPIARIARPEWMRYALALAAMVAATGDIYYGLWYPIVVAAITLVGRRPVVGLSESAMTGWSFLLGGSLLVVGFTMAGGSPTPTVTAASIALLVALAVFPTAAAYTFWFRGLRTSPASTAAVIAVTVCALPPLVTR